MFFFLVLIIIGPLFTANAQGIQRRNQFFFVSEKFAKKYQVAEGFDKKETTVSKKIIPKPRLILYF